MPSNNTEAEKEADVFILNSLKDSYVFCKCFLVAHLVQQKNMRLFRTCSEAHLHEFSR